MASVGNEVHSDADTAYWSKMPYWSLDEALMLSFGYEPAGLDGASAIAPEIARHRVLLKRAHETGFLTDPISPSAFLRWVAENNLRFPATLAEAVSSRPDTQTDWKAEVEHWKEMERRASDGFNYYMALAERRSDAITALEDEIKKLRADSLASKETKNLSHQRSFNTLLKLVGGMALAVYNYNRHDRRTDTIRQIQNDLDLKGVSLDADTIRKWIREGVSLVESADIKAK